VKAKSSQSYISPYAAAGSRRGSVQPDPPRRGSVQPELSSVPERPRLQSRTLSAPLVQQQRKDAGVRRGEQGRDAAAAIAAAVAAAAAPPTVRHPPAFEERDSPGQAAGGAMSDGQDEDEVAGVVGAVKKYQPFQSPPLSEPLTEINIAVIGGEGVGKSTFVQKALDLPHPPPSPAAERKIPIDGSVYLVRLLEMPIDDVDVDDDDTICFPDTIEDKVMPRIDGALTLYDVQDENSLESVPAIISECLSRTSGLPDMGGYEHVIH